MPRLLARIALGVPALALLVAAALVDADWWTRHVVVPACYLPPPLWMLPAVRIALAAAGFVLIIASLRVGRPTAAGAARVALAAVLGLFASELALRIVERDERRMHHPRLEVLLGAPDARTGWSFVPGRVLHFAAPDGGPMIEYAVDAHGDRALSPDFIEDASAPTLLIAGESIALGHGLDWPKTFAALAGARLGLQVVNVAEGGYGNDQALLRARDALQRLKKPMLLVSTVVPVQLHRNLNDVRPHLELRGGALELLPAFSPRIRLRELIADDLQVLPEWRLRRALALTRAILEATVREARDRGARPLFVAPVFGREPEILHELLDGLPHTTVEIEPQHLMPWDGHPDGEAARRIAVAIVQYVNSP